MPLFFPFNGFFKFREKLIAFLPVRPKAFAKEAFKLVKKFAPYRLTAFENDICDEIIQIAHFFFGQKGNGPQSDGFFEPVS